MEPTEQKQSKKPEGILRILISLLAGLCILCFLLLAVSAVFVFTEAPESWEKAASVLIVAVSAFFVGALCAKKARAKGFLWGLLGGTLFGILLWLVGMLLMTEGSNGFSWQSVLTTAGAGLLGGIVGINLTKK